MPENDSAHALARALNLREPEHVLLKPRARGTQLGNTGPVGTRDLLRTARQNRQKHPTPHRTLTRRNQLYLGRSKQTIYFLYNSHTDTSDYLGPPSVRTAENTLAFIKLSGRAQITPIFPTYPILPPPTLKKELLCG